MHFLPRQREEIYLFFKISRAASKSHKFSFNENLVLFEQGGRPGSKLTTDLSLVPRLCQGLESVELYVHPNCINIRTVYTDIFTFALKLAISASASKTAPV